MAGVSRIWGNRTTYGAPFFDLDRLSVGDNVTLQVRDGETFTYSVCEVDVVSLGTAVTDVDRPILILSTYHLKYTAREELRVTATLMPAE